MFLGVLLSTSQFYLKSIYMLAASSMLCLM